MLKYSVPHLVTVAMGAGEEAIKNKEGEIQDKKALNALFNKTVRYSVINNYIFTITELYI